MIGWVRGSEGGGDVIKSGLEVGNFADRGVLLVSSLLALGVGLWLSGLSAVVSSDSMVDVGASRGTRRRGLAELLFWRAGASC